MSSRIGSLLDQFCRQGFDAGSVESDGDGAARAVDMLEQVAEHARLLGAGHALPRTVEQSRCARQFCGRHLLTA